MGLVRFASARRLPRASLLLAIAIAAGCTADAGGSGLSLRDPLALIDDVYASGNRLRLYVLPAGSYACDPSTGTVTPAVPDVVVGTTPDAIVDLELGMSELTNREVVVPVGDWTVLVRGKGTDAGGMMNVEIARGCATATVANGETAGVMVALAPVASMGVCGNGLLTPDEQCEATPECVDCRTTPEPVNTTTAGRQGRPRVAARSGQQVVVAWADSATDVFQRLLTADARRIPAGGPLELDEELLAPGSQVDGTPAVAGDGRFAIAFADFGAGSSDGSVRVAFFGMTRMLLGTIAAARTDATGLQRNPAIAFGASNGALVVFEDARSSTGLSARAFDASGAAQGAEAVEVGQGQTGATAPAIAATSAGYVIAFQAAGDVFFQRLNADGTPVDAMAQRADDAAATREGATVAAAGDTFLVAWAEANAPGDGMGLGVRARIVTGGTPGAPFLVNTTLAGDQRAPSAAASAAGFVVAFESAPGVRARAFSTTGDPELNHERTPSFADFEVAAGGTAPSSAAVGSGATATWWIAFVAAGADPEDIFARRFPM